MNAGTHLTNAQARRIFLDRHALLEQPTGPAHGDALLDLISRLGFVQLDSVNTLARAHDLILFSRRPRYRPADLDRLYAARGLFEHWTHDASVVPMAFFPYWRLRMVRDEAELATKWVNWRREGFAEECQPALEHIRAHGACNSADLRGDAPGHSGAGGIGTHRKRLWNICGIPARCRSAIERDFANITI